MWTNLSALAQKAKDAAALIESEINNSIGFGDNMGSTDDDGGEAGHSRAPSSDGWDKCDISLHDGTITDGKLKMDNNENTKVKEMSFVDLKGEVDNLPINYQERKSDNERLVVPTRMDDSSCIDEPDSKSNKLKDALVRISSLEQQVSTLRGELASAHDTTLQLQKKIDDLEEQNKRLKESMKESGVNISS